MHRSQGKTTFLRREKMVNSDHCFKFKKEEKTFFSIGFSDMTFFTSLELSQVKFE